MNGAICLILFAPALGKVSLLFSAMEYFLVACFGVLGFAMAPVIAKMFRGRPSAKKKMA